VSSDSRSDRFGITIAVLGGLFVATATLLVVLLLARDGGGATTTTLAGGTTGTGATSTSADGTTAPPTTTTAVATTATTTTTTTTTTTLPPFAGDLEDKTGPAQGTPVGRLSGLRSASHEGYTRVVFDFPDGGIPGYWIGYTGSNTLTLLLYPMSWGNPYDDGIFDAGGSHPVGLGSVEDVRDGGMGGGSGEWTFQIWVTEQRPFLVGTLDGPPRIYVDIGD
jgi:hypothetical protein